MISKFELVSQQVFKQQDGRGVLSAYVVPTETAGGMPLRNEKHKKDSRGLIAFKGAFEAEEEASGETRPEHGNGLERVVVPYERVKEAFGLRYTKRNEKPDSLRRAFTRALKEAQQASWVREGHWDDTDWLWRVPDLDLA